MERGGRCHDHAAATEGKMKEKQKKKEVMRSRVVVVVVWRKWRGQGEKAV